jgi:hypothetical protein
MQELELEVLQQRASMLVLVQVTTLLTVPQETDGTEALEVEVEAEAEVEVEAHAMLSDAGIVINQDI